MMLNDGRGIDCCCWGGSLSQHRHIICLILPPSHPSGLKSINLFFRLKDISTSQIEIWTNGKPWKPDENPRVQIS